MSKHSHSARETGGRSLLPSPIPGGRGAAHRPVPPVAGGCWAQSERSPKAEPSFPTAAVCDGGAASQPPTPQRSPWEVTVLWGCCSPTLRWVVLLGRTLKSGSRRGGSSYHGGQGPPTQGFALLWPGWSSGTRLHPRSRAEHWYLAPSPFSCQGDARVGRVLLLVSPTVAQRGCSGGSLG